MAVYDTQGRPVVVDIESAYTAGVQGAGVSTVGNTAGNTGTSSGTLVFAGSNIITVSQSTGTGGNTVWINASAAGAADGVNVVSLSGNTVGTLSTQSTGTVVLAGGANITLSQSSNSITISGGGGGGGAAISAGTESQNTGTVVFSNSNGIGFGLNAGTLTAQHTGQIINALSFSGNTQFGNYASSGTVTVGIMAPLKLAFNANAGTLTYEGVSIPAVSAANGSFSFSTLKFVDTSGVSWSTATDGIRATVKTDYLTTAAASNHSHGNPSLALTNLSGTTASNSAGLTLSLSAGNYLTTAAASNHSHGNPTLNLTNLSGTTASNSAGLTLSLSVGNYLTTAAASDHTHSQYAGTNGAITGGSITVNTSGVSVNLPAYLTTAAASNHSHGNPTLNLTNLSGTTASNSAGLTLSLSAAAPGGGIAASLSGNSTSGGAGYSNVTSGTLILAGGNNITLSQDGSRVTISGANIGGAQTGISGIGASDTTYSSGTVIWSGQNNITVGTSVNGASQYVRLSVGNYLTTAAASDHSHGNPSLALTNLSGTTASNSAGLTLSLSAANPAGGGVAISAGTWSATSGTVVFSNTYDAVPPSDGGVSFGLNGQTLSGKVRTWYPALNTGTSPISTGWAYSGTSSSQNGNSISVTGGYLFFSTAGTNFTLQTTLGSSSAPGTGAETYYSYYYGLIGSVPNFLTTAAQSNQVVNSLNGSTGQVSLATGSSLSSSQNGSTITFGLASNITTALQSAGAYLTTAAQSNQVVNSVNGSTGQISLATGSSLSSSSNGSTITFGLASNITTALQSANANYLTSQSNQAVSGSNASSTFQTVTFGNSNGMSFYLTNGSMVGSYTVPTVPAAYVSSVNGSSGAISFATGSSLSSSQNGSTVTWGLASNITTALQSAGAYLTTAALSNHSHGVTLALTNLAGTTGGNSNGITISLSHNLSTAALSNHSHGNPQLNLTNLSGTTASGSGGFTLSLSAGNYLTTARASNDAIGLNTAATNVTWTVGSAGLSLNAGGYAGTGTSATNASITLNSAGLAISVAAPGAAAEANWINLSGNTAGNTTASGSTIKWYGGNNITLHGTNGSEVSIIGGAGGGGAAVGISTDGQTSGNTGTYTSGTYVFAGSNSLTLHQSTGGGGVHTLWLKPAMSQLTAGDLISLSSDGSTVSVIGKGAGTGSTFAGTNVSASITLNTVGLNLALSAGGGGGGVALGVSNTGHTAGNTGTYSTGTFVFAGSNSLTLSQSTGGGSVHTIWLQPLNSALSGGAGISLSTTGSTIVIYTV